MHQHPYGRCLMALRALQAGHPLPGRPGARATWIAHGVLGLIIPVLLALALA